MKVLVYTTLFPNNVQPNNAIFIKQRMFHFAKLDGCEIKVVAPVPFCPQWHALRTVLRPWYGFALVKRKQFMEGIEVFHPRYPLLPKISMIFHGLLLLVSSLPTVRRIARTFSFDLIDSHYIYPDGFAAVLLGKMLKKPVVLSARGSDINQFSDFTTIKPMLKYALREADHIISVCDALKQEMLRLGAEEERVSVIPNGIDTQKFRPESKEAARIRLSIPRDKNIILSVGSLIPRKGFHIILEAIPSVIKNSDEVHLYIIGEGSYRRDLEDEIAMLGIHEYVTLVGERPNSELVHWYGAADVFCLASSREGWANVIMESLACGTPVVATNVWGAPEILTTAEVGILVDRKPQSIAKGLLSALSREWDRELIRRHVAGRSWDVVAREVKGQFSEVIRRNKNLGRNFDKSAARALKNNPKERSE